jgi:hypothetical protein
MVVNNTDMLLTLPKRHAQLLNAGLLNTGLMNRVYPFPLPMPHLEAHLYWHESVENDSANHWLRKEIETVLASDPQSPATVRTASRGRRRGRVDDEAPARSERRRG